jgi:hypothetical protein
MGFRKRLLGVGDYTFDILVFTGLVIREHQINYVEDETELEEIWEIWEWMVFYEANTGVITKEQFLQIYAVVGKDLKQFKFEYQKNDQEIGRRFALLYNDIQKVLYPSLPVAFLPTGYGSEIWPLTGKPVRNVRTRAGFGETIPEQIINTIEQHNIKVETNSSQELLIYLCSSAFVKTLTASNEKGRSERLGLRTSAYELLPFFICFDLFKFQK